MVLIAWIGIVDFRLSLRSQSCDHQMLLWKLWFTTQDLCSSWLPEVLASGNSQPSPPEIVSVQEAASSPLTPEGVDSSPVQWERPVLLPVLGQLRRAVGLHNFLWCLCFMCLAAQLLHLSFLLPSLLTEVVPGHTPPETSCLPT